MKKLLSFLIACGFLVPALALGQLNTTQGGTGTSSPSGILYGDGTLHLKTVTIGSNLSFTTGTLSATAGSGVGTSTNPFMATYYVATSTLKASVFPLASTTAVSATSFCLVTCITAFTSGTVTAVTGTYPIISSGGTTPNLTFPATSTIFGTGTGGQYLVWSNGLPTWSASTTYQHPLSFSTSTGQVQCTTCSTATGANPSASVGSASATNGSAVTFMRSDGAPACTAATATAPGCITALNWAQFNAKVGTSTADTANQVTFFSTTNATPALLSGNAALTFSTTGNTLLTFTNGTTTNLTVGTSLGIPSSASQAPTVAGYIAQDTTNDQLKVGDGSVTSVLDPRRNLKLTYATTTAWSGTTTLPVFVIPQALSWNTVQCITDAGTLNVQYQYGTAPTKPAMFNASTTVGTITWTTSNTPAAGATSTIAFGTPASSPTQISCTLTGPITGT